MTDLRGSCRHLTVNQQNKENLNHALLCLWLLLKQEKTKTLVFLTNKLCGQCFNTLGPLSIIGPQGHPNLTPSLLHGTPDYQA